MRAKLRTYELAISSKPYRRIAGSLLRTCVWDGDFDNYERGLGMGAVGGKGESLN